MSGCLQGFFLNGIFPLVLELGVELTYPIDEHFSAFVTSDLIAVVQVIILALAGAYGTFPLTWISAVLALPCLIVITAVPFQLRRNALDADPSASAQVVAEA